MASRPPNHSAERERFVEDLLDIMSMEEKVGQLVLRPAPSSADSSDIRHIRDQLKRGHLGGIVGEISQAEIATLKRITVEETRLSIPLLFGNEVTRGTAVVMPSLFALAASWESRIVERTSAILAAEAREAGKNWLLAPDVLLSHLSGDRDITRTWGISEFLARTLAAASVRGFEGKDGGDGNLLACLRVDDPSWTTRRTQTALADKFRLVAGVLRESPPASVALDPATQDAIDIGGSSDSPAFSIGGPGGYDGIDLAEWTDIARAAGQEKCPALFMGLSLETVMAALKDGRVTPLQIDDAVRRVIGAKYDLGLFRTHAPDTHASPAPSSEDARAVALDAALHSIVLLRNKQALLPLDICSRDTLVVGLAASDRSLCTGDGREGTSLTEGLDALGFHYKYAPGLALREGQNCKLINADRMAIGMASEAARRSRTVVAVLGESGELGEAAQALIDALYAANRNVVLVTLGSRPTDPDVCGEKLPCVLHAGDLGSASGHAIARVLTGAFAPCGRLPIALLDKGRPSLSLGHGLGFSQFALDDHTIELSHDRVVASCVLHNNGEREGLETVQLYLKRPDNRGLGRFELADFQRISLLPGENRRLIFELGGNQLGRFESNGSFVIDPGSYVVAIGLNEGQAHAAEISIPPAVAEAIGKTRSVGLFPTLFGRMQSSG